MRANGLECRAIRDFSLHLCGSADFQGSGGVLELPDCVRFRKDDRNEIGGIDPDVLIGFRENDGPTRKNLRLQQKLPEIVRVTIEGISR